MMKKPVIFLSLFLLCSATSLRAEGREFFDFMVKNKNLLAAAKADEAYADLIQWQNEHPEVIKNPSFCYQLFFVALEGRGDRETARLMLQRLDHLVTNDKLSPSSAIYRSVTQAWYRALSHTDSDLPRQAHQIMQTRLEMQPKQQP